MGAYILRRMLLIIPTLFGIMLINFALTQFVPGGPIEQILARLDGSGDVFENISGGGGDVDLDAGDTESSYIGARGLPKEFIEDLEREFGLMGGDIFHGAMGLDQLFSARPVLGHGDYRTPVDGLYLCGAGSHPGGGVMGCAGRNAAQAVLNGA